MRHFLLEQLSNSKPPNLLAVEKLRAWLGKALPTDLEGMLATCDGWMGYWNPDHFVDLWGSDSIRGNNEAYLVGRCAPELLLIGSDGCGEGLAYDLAIGSGSLFHVPFVGLSRERMVFKADSLDDYLAGLGPPAPSPTISDDIEIVELKPVLFGGHPTDERNKARLTRNQHIEFVNFWNKLFADLRDSAR